ncbi:hypothetical protein JCM19236_4510 [Vibrio sp. JCM 19236]|nr:hypothetical protein JCM19236_4510 [Vibrio sp. JCM 19236]
MSETVIDLKDVRFTWPDAPKPTLDIHNLEVKRGEHVFIKGRVAVVNPHYSATYRYY